MITEWVEQKIAPKLSAVTCNRYFMAFRSAFFAVMPLTIIGSVFMLITDFPVEGYSEFMAGFLGQGWEDFISPAYRATFNSLGFLLAGTLTYKLAESYKLDKLTVAVLGLVAYIVVMPKTVVTDSGEVVGRVLSFNWLGTQGVMTAIITSIITVELFRWCVEKDHTIDMPDSVPPMVANAFTALIPGILIVTVLLIINGICVSWAGSLPEAIFKFLQVPLQALVGAPGAIVVIGLLNGLFWWFGIHPTVINSLINPFLIANADANQALADAGNLSIQTGAVGCIQFVDQYLTIGGAGMTIGLTISMIMIAKSQRMKGVSKVAFVPSLFNINEPCIFGIPMIFEPLMLIPMMLCPVVSSLVVIFSMNIGFMPLFTNVQAPWATPFMFSGFLVAGWRGAVVQVIIVALSVAIYMPFVRALDKQFQEEENAKLEGNNQK